MAQPASATSLRAVDRIAPLLYCSGACALVYQVVWLREFRLVFGASTAASSAVLAIFMGGLGVGGWLLGGRADKRKNPLMLYANLELGVSALAAVTPLLVDATRFLYSSLGGTSTLGMTAGTIVRLILAALVLLPPTLLMGGTLPAAAKAAETDDDAGRRHLGILYGVNTLGAVTGAALSTFVLLEVFGGRVLLWVGCLLNALLGLAARSIARGLAEGPVQPAATEKTIESTGEANDAAANPSGDEVSSEKKIESEQATDKTAQVVDGDVVAEDLSKVVPNVETSDVVPHRFVLVAAAIVGFVFLLMELVFYRILGPVLGGSSYTFGLILVVALLGVGLGGAAYPVWLANRPATVRAFALTCALEALCFAIPYALGDRIALFALSLRSLQALGFVALASGWFVVALVVVLPAAFVSGLQFPLLIALLGRGRKDVGQHVGLAYAWNTAGAIGGSLAGGFGLLPWLTAPGAWRLSAFLLLALGVAALVLSMRGEKKDASLGVPAAITLVALVLLRSVGPTAALRHSPIGAGRADKVMHDGTMNKIRDWQHTQRRHIEWDAEGIESTVALSAGNGYAFVVNGKSDGHARGDAGTQVMSGLIGALVHPSPKKAMVVGLGTGSTAGWLGAIPSMERVDVVELEPAILRVARDCSAVNQNVMDNPKVSIFIGDAREVLITTKSRYDIIFSEPSNPYRAGIASLFTRDFYQSAAKRMERGGIFLQWLQAYEVDAGAIRTVYATLVSVFPNVETWITSAGDFVLAASFEPIEYDPAVLRARLAEEPFRSAAQNAWRVSDLEGFFAHYLANATFAREIVKEEGVDVNTDDRNLLEASFVRIAGREVLTQERNLALFASELKLDRPQTVRGPLDYVRVEDERVAMMTRERKEAYAMLRPTSEQKARGDAFGAYVTGNLAKTITAWQSQPRPATSLAEVAMIAHAHAELGHAEALEAIEKLRAFIPTEADALLAIYHLRKGDTATAGTYAVKAFEAYRTNPWPDPQVMLRLLAIAPELATKDKAVGRKLYDTLSEPFAIHMADDERKRVRMQLASRIDFVQLCVDAVAAYEPHVPFRESFLTKRYECYLKNRHPRARIAAQELTEFYENDPPGFRQISDEPEQRPLQ